MKMVHTESIGLFVIYLHTKFHKPSSIDSLLTSVRLKGNYSFCTATILFYILQNIDKQMEL
jgi:hypothetical protein